MLGVLFSTGTAICGRSQLRRRQQVVRDQMQRLPSPFLMSSTAARLRYAPKNGEKIRILTGCNQKLNAGTDPRSDFLQVQVSGQASRSQRSFFWSSRSVTLHLLSCSRTESCTGSLSAGLGRVWSGTEIETVGIMSKGRSRRSSALQLGESRPDFP